MNKPKGKTKTETERDNNKMNTVSVNTVELTPAQLHEMANLADEIVKLKLRFTSIVTGAATPVATPAVNGKGKHRGRPKGSHMTAEHKAAIAKGAEKRWAKFHAEKAAAEAAKAAAAPIEAPVAPVAVAA